MGLAALGPPDHDPAVKIDVLLDLPPSSSVSGVNSRMACVSPKRRQEISKTTQRSDPENPVYQLENRLLASIRYQLCSIYSVYCVRVQHDLTHCNSP